MDLYEEITRLIKELDLSVKQLRKSGTEFAEAEQNYKIKLRQEALKLPAFSYYRDVRVRRGYF